MNFRIWLVASLLLLSGCAGKHVYFFSQNTQVDGPGETRVFIDARGHLYPRTGLPTFPEDYELPSRTHGSLFEAASDRESGLCEQAESGSEMELLCNRIMQLDCDERWSECFDRWERAQGVLWQQRGQQIALSLRGTDNVTLVLLIHGFNNRYHQSESNFDFARRGIESVSAPDINIHFVEVYWDGCTSGIGGPGCWGKAQSTGPLVGFSLRQLLNAIEDNWDDEQDLPHIRILTHSSGAFVAGAIVGNPIDALPQLRNTSTNRRYMMFANHASDTQEAYRVPQFDDIRLAMLAAATPYTTFIGGDSYRGGALVNNLQMLISVQPRDKVITKYGLGCNIIGESCLGARRADVCELSRQLQGTNRMISVTGYDFSRDPAEWPGQSTLHDFKVYVRQAVENSSFLSDFMGDSNGQDRPGGEGAPFDCTG